MNAQETPKQFTAEELRRLLPHGAQAKIAKEIGKTPQAVSAAISKMKPSNKAVQLAIQMVRDNGSAYTAAMAAQISQALHPEAA